MSCKISSVSRVIYRLSRTSCSLPVIGGRLKGQRGLCQYREHAYNRSHDRKGGQSNLLALGGSVLVAASFFDMFKKNNDNYTEKENQLRKHIGMCTMHLHQAEPNLAKPHFERAYKMLEDDLNRTKHTPIPSMKLTYLTDQLGNIALQLECYPEAINLYLATVNGFALNGIERSNRTVTELFLKIGQIYAILGDYKLAEMSFLHCVNVTTAELSKTEGPKNPNVVTLAGLAYEGLGKVYLSMNLHDNALNMYTHAIEFAERVFGKNDPQLSVLLNDLATVYEAMEQYDLALETVEKALLLAKDCNPAALPAILCNQATILLFKGDFLSARTLYDDLYAKCLRMQDFETIREIKANMKILEEKERMQTI